MIAPNTVSVSILADPAQPPKQFTNITWYPGLTVLQALIVAQAMNPAQFSFRILYHSAYGAFVDMIDDVADADPQYWMFSVSNNPSAVGVSEAIVLEDPSGENVEVEWNFGIPSAAHAKTDQLSRKKKALRPPRP